jgi:hypothetical protein
VLVDVQDVGAGGASGDGQVPAEERGRPLMDTITASRIANMKEPRPPSAGLSVARILLVFDP